MRTSVNMDPFLRYTLVVVLFGRFQVNSSPEGEKGNVQILSINIACHTNEMIVTVNTKDSFSGMIYPKGLSRTSNCLKEYDHALRVRYRIPLRSCNTMSEDVDGSVEYYNTIVVQPHRKLVTNQGQAYSVRCRYETSEKRLTSLYQVSPEFRYLDNNLRTSIPFSATAAMPGSSMKIFTAEGKDHLLAENVRIGDLLTLQISIDEQDIYGMKVTDCAVRDGLGWGEQVLINAEGCSVDEEIMQPFIYISNLTKASVDFRAHRFPYTASVYYQCNVQLCLKGFGHCYDVPPFCKQKQRGGNWLRRKRQVIRANHTAPTIEVFSGFYVSEEQDVESDSNNINDNKAILYKDKICISPRDFAIGIAIAGFVLMLAVIAVIFMIISRRRRKLESSTTGSSIYSGPYSNAAFSYTS